MTNMYPIWYDNPDTFDCKTILREDRYIYLSVVTCIRRELSMPCVPRYKTVIVYYTVVMV